MIRPLRRRHALMATLLLALLAPAGLVAGLSARPEQPLMSGLPREVAPQEVLPSGSVARASLTVEGVPVAVRTWGVGPERNLQLAPEGDVRVPDVLVYWTPGSVGDASGPPPAEALLIGSFAGSAPRTFALPDAARDEGGSVVLYSLAHRRGLGAAKLQTP